MRQFEYEDRDEFGLARVNLTHNMQEQVELYQDVIQFELRDPVKTQALAMED